MMASSKVLKKSWNHWRNKGHDIICSHMTIIYDIFPCLTFQILHSRIYTRLCQASTKMVASEWKTKMFDKFCAFLHWPETFKHVYCKQLTRSSGKRTMVLFARKWSQISRRALWFFCGCGHRKQSSEETSQSCFPAAMRDNKPISYCQMYG